MFIDPGEQFCIDFPYEDDKAIAACQWILDVGSPFRVIKLHHVGEWAPINAPMQIQLFFP